ncbi:PCI domain-containing protein [Dimargaris cristalligena]|uniref:COP9 signalosome complex subunit 2 n=1 Tax=Dimargaris cristalligena TaxID=215637 RepID=A0A4P9ZRQ5_9FUNG|nr:PCI domain-containing protein [Dimargaris cristalligena]|eukprot:RKP35441.1 PCI domain-containing protein [Dimargaris cristalligena]
MSDDDFMLEDDDGFDYDYDDNDYGNGADEDDDPLVVLENKYYRAKALKEEDPVSAIPSFEDILDTETDSTEWGFKALKQLIKLHCQAGAYDQAVQCYERLFGYTASVVTRNHSEKSINNILDRIGSLDNIPLLERFYTITLKALEETKNERFWIKTNLKLAKLYLQKQEFTKLRKIIQKLHTICQIASAGDDQLKGTHLLETYALEIQLYTATKNNKKLKEVYHQCVKVRSAIPHPRIMGVIYECGGKMYMDEQNWPQAQSDFFESFKNYDEAGSPQRIQVLKYLVLASMLSESSIDPFESPETKPYKNDPEIMTMTNLIMAYQKQEIAEFERIFQEHEKTIMSDPFVFKYMEGVMRTIRSQVLINTIRPYTQVDLQHLAKELNITVDKTEELLIILILDGKVTGSIDQVNRQYIAIRKPTTAALDDAMAHWVDTLALSLKQIRG